MDHFGIGVAIHSMACAYSSSARQSGRTTRLVESAKDGDRIVFCNVREAKRVETLCRARGVKVDCIVIPIHEPFRVRDRKPSEGRTIFDHTWVEQYYVATIANAQKEIDFWQREGSGTGMGI